MSGSIANATERSERRYISAAMDAPFLEREHEAELARRWRDEQDEEALHEIIESHARLVIRIASRYRRTGIVLGDLVQEGNIGLLEAASRFDPARNTRFSTYATWWIVRMIRNFLMRNASIIRVATTPNQRRVYFNLWRLRASYPVTADGTLRDEDQERIAKELRVSVADVRRIDNHFAHPDQSLNLMVGEGESTELQELIPDDGPTPDALAERSYDDATRAGWLDEAMQRLSARERQVIRRRFLEGEKSTLAEIGETFGVTKERIRQIERQALLKMRATLAEQVADTAEFFTN